MVVWQSPADRSREAFGRGAASLGWRSALALIVALYLIILLVYRDTAMSLFALWSSSNLYGHGYLILPASMFLLWLRRGKLAAMAPRPSAVGLGMIAMAAVVWLLGEAASINLLRHVALVAMLPALYLMVLGLRIAFASLLPLACLLFAVPVGGELIPALQQFTGAAVASILVSTGIPAFLEANYLIIPAGRFEIAEACAGARFLIASLAAAVFGSDMLFCRWWKRFAFIAAAIVIAILGNAVRAYLIVAIAAWRGLEAGMTFDHITFGFVFLGFILVTLFSLGLVFKDDRPVEAPAPMAEVNAESVPPKLRLIAAAALVAALVPPLAMRIGAPTTEVRNLLLGPLENAGPWRAQAGQGAAWRPVIANADGELNQRFVSASGAITLHVAYLTRQRQGAELVQEQNRYAGVAPWREIGRTETVLNVAGHVVRAPCSVIDDGTTQRLACHFFWINGYFTGSPATAKLRQIWDRLVFDDGPAAVIGYSVAASEGAVAAADRANRLFQSLRLDTWLQTRLDRE